MRFLRKDNIDKTIIVISDIHLGAGLVWGEHRNELEDFHYDQELVEFLEYYSKDEYAHREVNLIINGDFLDFLAVPYVSYFDDEFWSERASLQKIRLIIQAHKEVFQALSDFLKAKNKTLTYIIGNHDAELIFESLQKFFLSQFEDKLRERIEFILNPEGDYRPEKAVALKHGHEYERAHQFNPIASVVADDKGAKYFIPPWGSYYVVRVINKFKQERPHINAVRPIKKFMINGLIYDTLFTLRFIFANIYYFLMVRIIYFIQKKYGLLEIYKHMKNEMHLFKDYEELTRDFFEKNPDVKVLLVGHTHDPIYRPYPDGTTFINTGTWTKMHQLDFYRQGDGPQLTYAQIDFKNENNEMKIIHSSLYNWHGQNTSPFSDY